MLSILRRLPTRASTVGVLRSYTQTSASSSSVLCPRADKETFEKLSSNKELRDSVKSLQSNKHLGHPPLLDTLNKLSQVLQLAVPRIHKARPHLQVLQCLHERAELLCSGKLHGTVGNSSCALLGAQGIGKSTVLRAATVFFPHLYKEQRLHTLYVDYEALSRNEYLQTTPLDQVIIDHLEASGLTIPPARLAADNVDRIRTALEKEDSRLMVMVDEVERIYENNDPEISQVSLCTLGALSGMANSHSGRFAVVLCGSSQYVPHLIFAKRTDADTAKRFPLENVSDLNDTKVKLQHIDQSRPNDLQDVQEMLALSVPTEEAKKVARLIVFMCGPNARAMDHFTRLLKLVVKFQDDEFAVDSMAATALPVQDSGMAGSTAIEVGPVLSAILDKMYYKNQVLFDPLLEAGDSVTLDMITRTEWEKFIPLTPQEVNEIAAKHSERIGDVPQQQMMYWEIQWLVNQSWLHQVNDDELFPSKFLDIIMHRRSQASSSFRTCKFAKTIVREVNDGMKALLRRC